MTPDQTREREAFEAYLRGEGVKESTMRRAAPEGPDYDNGMVQGEWTSWLAATARARGEVEALRQEARELRSELEDARLVASAESHLGGEARADVERLEADVAMYRREHAVYVQTEADLKRTKAELQSWKDGEQGEIARFIEQERKLRADLERVTRERDANWQAAEGYKSLYIECKATLDEARQLLRDRTPPTPATPAVDAAEREVVEAAMARWKLSMEFLSGKRVPIRLEMDDAETELQRSCVALAALDRAATAESEPVRVAAERPVLIDTAYEAGFWDAVERLRSIRSDEVLRPYPRSSQRLWGVRTVLDALDAKGVT